ncbi:hypothetical protein AVEN_178413-1 [Araneus ventricosus]|uniref:Uncharacterized protein n=1 Tax=Araneus ventricosus TaxID=182803 RepID=A0A4Y2BE37_ARAVE|nr:hypothetical protein AVEN_178413-1 [Araneus ventricosus]
MKPFDFMHGRKQETDDEKEEQIVEYDEENFGYFQQEMEAAEEVIYLESSMFDFSTNLFVFIDNIIGARMKIHYSYVCGIQEVDGGKYDMTDLRTTNLAKPKFVSVVNDQFVIF